MSKVVISKFKEYPKTRTAWWAMGLGLSTVFAGPILGISAAVLVPAIGWLAGETVGAVVGSGVAILVFSITVAALVAGIRAFRKGERSWVMWIGFVPAIGTGLFWIMMIAGEFAFPH